MRQMEDLLQVISAIYSVPGDENAWPAALAQLGQLVGGHGIAYMLINKEDGALARLSHTGYTEEFERRYKAGGLLQDIRFHYLDRLVPGKVFREFEYVPDRAAYDANELVQYQLKTLGHYWTMSAHVSTHGLWRDIITVNRFYTRGPHTDEEKADLQALLPHLSRMAELDRTVTRLRDRYGAVLSVLDKLLVGLVILDAAGRLVVANATARACCEAAGSLRLDGRLRATHAQSDAELQRLIQATAMTANGRESKDGGLVVLEKRGRRGSLLLEVMPIRDDGLPDGDNIKGTAVFIIDPASPLKLSAAGLAKIFQLTPTEHEVADALLNGAEVREIAEQRGNSIETVRTHLKSILAKTGSGSQLELLRLTVKANPPIEHKKTSGAQPPPGG